MTTGNAATKFRQIWLHLILRLDHDQGCIRKDRKRESSPVTAIRANINNTAWCKAASPKLSQKAGYGADFSAAITVDLNSKRAKPSFNCRFDSVLHTTTLHIDPVRLYVRLLVSYIDHIVADIRSVRIAPPIIKVSIMSQEFRLDSIFTPGSIFVAVVIGKSHLQLG